MDKRLKLLKTYLDSRIKSYEKLTGLPLGDQVLEMRMLVNSDPGLIRIFAGAGTPSEERARIVDVWYNGKFFAEKSITGWNRFDKYSEEFTTTILDAYSDQFPVDVPLKIEIEGPQFVDLSLNRLVDYRVYMTLESGSRHYLDEAVFSVEDRSNRVTITTDSNGMGTTHLAALTNTTNFVVKASFKLGDFNTLYASLPVQAFLEGTTLDEIYTIIVSGPDKILYGETGSYTAILHTEYVADGTVETRDVTNVVAWSADQDGNMSLQGSFTPARPEQIQQPTAIHAVMTIALGNGSTFDVAGSKDIIVERLAVREVIITGPDRVKENKTAQYEAKVVFVNGDEDNNFSPIIWDLQEQSLGTLTDAGLYQAPMVEADTPQSIRAEIEFDGANYRGDKDIMVLDVEAPILTIVGPNSIYDTDTASFQASVTFDGETVDVNVTDWSIDDTLKGSINLNGIFRPNRNPENVIVNVRASMVYQGYEISDNTDLLVYASALRPVGLTISGVTAMMEGTTTNFIAIAVMSDGTELDVTNSVTWSVDNQDHAISATGWLTAAQVNTNTKIQVTARYALNGSPFVKAVHPVTINDDPIIWAPIGLSLSGPGAVNEEETAQFSVTLTMRSNKGDTKTVSDPEVEWRSSTMSSIDATGLLTANSVVETTETIVSAIFNDGVNLPLTASKPVTILNVPLLVNLIVTPQDGSIFGGFSTPFTATLLKKTGAPVDVTSHADISYVTNPANIIVVDKANKRLIAGQRDETTNVTITATYREAGESANGSAVLEVKANEAGSLVLSPDNIIIFEGETQQLSTVLGLTTGGSISVVPTYEFDPALGSIDANGLFTAGSADDDFSGVIVAKYVGDETAGEELVSNEATVEVKAIRPELLEIKSGVSGFSVMEGDKIYLTSVVHFNNGLTLDNDPNVTYSIAPADEQYVTLTHDLATGVLEIFGKDVTADRVVPVTATFIHPDAPGGKLEETRVVTVRYQRQVVELILSLASGPYFSSRSYNLTLKERYDDGTTSAVTGNVSWNYNPQQLSIANYTATISATAGDFTISATKGGITSNTVTGAISVNRPVAITIYPEDGTSINRDETAKFSASMQLSDGTITSPSSTWPVTWSLSHEDLGTLEVGNDYTALFTAISALTSGTVTVTAAFDTIEDSVELEVAGFALVTGVTISGPNSVISGKSAQYDLTINYSDNSVKVITAGSAETAMFELLFTDPRFTAAGSISSNGEFVAPAHAANEGIIGEVRAAYFDQNSQTYIDAVPFEVTVEAAPPIVPVSAIINGADSMNANSTQEYTMVVTMSEGPALIIGKNTAEKAVWSATRGTITDGSYKSADDPVGYIEIIRASYGSADADKEVTVRPKIATALIANPTNIDLFEGGSIPIEVRTNTGVVVKPLWTVSNPAAGSVDSFGVFNAAQVNSDVTTTMIGKYSGIETNNVELPVTVGVKVKDLTADRIDIVPLDGGLFVDEQGTARFKTVIRRTDGTSFDAVDNVLYTAESGGSFVSMQNDDAILTLTGLNVIANQTVVIKAEYTHVDGKKTFTTENITVRNTLRIVTSLVAEIAAPKANYFEGESVGLRVRERYDDGTFNSDVVSGVTWTVSNGALATVTGNTAALANNLSSDQTVTVTASYNGRTSDPVSIPITDIVPASIAITSSSGATVKRGANSTFTAKITLNNGQQVDPSAAFPITWSNTNSGAGSFTQVSQRYEYTAANSNSDVDFKVRATAANKVSVFTDMDVKLDGYPIPVSAIIDGLTEVAAGSVTDYTMKVTMSDATVREISATKTTFSAAWTTTLSFAGSGGSFNTANGRLTAGTTAGDRTGSVSAVYTDSVSGQSVPASKSITIKAALPVPVSGTLSGPETVAAGSTNEYELQVGLSDGSNVIVNSSSVETAVWSTTIAGATLVKGSLAAPMAGGSGSITAKYTKNGQDITRTLTVTVSAPVTTTTPAPGSWEDAVYVGQIPHVYGKFLEANDATMVSKLSGMLITPIAVDGNQPMLRKKANATKLFEWTDFNLDYWRDESGQFTMSGAAGNVTERAIVLYPAKYGKATFNEQASPDSPYYFTDTVDTSSVNKLITDKDSQMTDLNPNGEPMTISLPVNGTATQFYVYLTGKSTTGPTSANPLVSLKIRSV